MNDSPPFHRHPEHLLAAGAAPRAAKGFGPFDDDFDPFEDDEETDILLPLE
jgi:hypothetical protein